MCKPMEERSCNEISYEREIDNRVGGMDIPCVAKRTAHLIMG